MTATALSKLNLDFICKDAKRLAERADSVIADKSWLAAMVKDLAGNLALVIDAIHADGLAPKETDPEVEALRGLPVSGCGPYGGGRLQTILDDIGTRGLVDDLHDRGFEIVKANEIVARIRVEIANPEADVVIDDIATQLERGCTYVILPNDSARKLVGE